MSGQGVQDWKTALESLGVFVGMSPLEQVRAAGCDAPDGGVYNDGKGGFTCRCMVCGRCGHHTGNANQGHYWAYCKVQAARDRQDAEREGRKGFDASAGMREFHFCCPGDCELEQETE